MGMARSHLDTSVQRLRRVCTGFCAWARCESQKNVTEIGRKINRTFQTEAADQDFEALTESHCDRVFLFLGA